MTRRSALALAALPLRFGFSLYGIKPIPVRTALDLYAQIGYRAVEFALMPGWDTEPKLLAKSGRKRAAEEAANLHLTLPALMENLKLLGPEAEQRTDGFVCRAARNPIFHTF